MCLIIPEWHTLILELTPNPNCVTAGDSSVTQLYCLRLTEAQPNYESRLAQKYQVIFFADHTRMLQ